MNGLEQERARRGADVYEAFHWGRPAKSVTTKRPPAPPRSLVELGRLERVVYSTHKKGDGPSDYEHQFGEEGGKRPRLAVDPDTDRLHIVGGDYRVEPRGIVD